MTGPAVEPRSWTSSVAIVLGLVLVAAVAAFILAQAGAFKSSPGVNAADAPASGEIWFGSSFDPKTLALAGKTTSIVRGQPVAFVAHLSRASTGEVVHLELSIAGIPASWPGGRLDAGNDLMGEVLPGAEIFQPGTVTVRVVDVGGNVLASGQITAN